MTNISHLYNERAQFYDRVMNVVRHRATRRHLVRALPSPSTLPRPVWALDLGCGTGLVAQVLLPYYPALELIGCDVAENMLAIHQQRYPQVPLLLGDFNRPHNWHRFPGGQATQLSPNFFDLIISAGALSEYGDLRRALPWCWQLLKPGGRLINIGVSHTPVGSLTGKLWQFTPCGPARFAAACQTTGFRRAWKLPATWSAFPKNLTDYVVCATK